LLPFFYAAAVDGLDAAVAWVARRRRTWHLQQAQRVFGAAFVGFAVLLSTMLYLRDLPTYRGAHPYSEVAAWMDAHVPSAAPVMVNDPASFYYHSRRPCLSIPNADLEVVLAVMERYGAKYLVLDENNPSLRDLYERPLDDARLARLTSFSGEGSITHLFSLQD
jgi:hypothetical protein